MELLNEVFAIALSVLMFLAIRGLWSICWEREASATRYFTRGLCLVFAATTLRALYWDVLTPILLAFDVWEIWFSRTDFYPNIVFMTFAGAGAFHILKSLYLMLPEDQRDHWSMWSVAFYPHGTCWRRVVKEITKGKNDE